jgi:hypothetical protein
MKRYIVKVTDESGSYIRGDNYLLHLTIRDNLTKQVSTPSSVKIKIDNECGNEVLAETDMTSLGSGQYSYDYVLPANAPYGKYKVTVSTTTYTQKEVYPFYLFPWDVVDEVRMISGIGQNKMISDLALSELIWEAYKEAKEYVYSHKYKVKAKPCMSSKSGFSYCIDGSNTTFFIPEPLGDYNGDGVITGWGEQSCGTDVDGFYIDNDSDRHQVKITVLDSKNGKVKVVKLNNAAIESDAKGLWFDYYTESGAYNEDLFRTAVMYLSAHKCILRFGELERASSADLAVAQNVKYVDPVRMWSNYKLVIRKIAAPKAGGVY